MTPRTQFLKYLLDEKNAAVPLCEWSREKKCYRIVPVKVTDIRILLIQKGAMPWDNQWGVILVTKTVRRPYRTIPVIYTFHELHLNQDDINRRARCFSVLSSDERKLANERFGDHKCMYSGCAQEFIYKYEDYLHEWPVKFYDPGFLRAPWFPGHAIVATIGSLRYLFPKDIIWIIVDILCNILSCSIHYQDNYEVCDCGTCVYTRCNTDKKRIEIAF